MNTPRTPNLKPKNWQTYQKLIVQIEASQGVVSPLIAVCDYLPLRERIIRAYEQELTPEINAYHVLLDPHEPSLKRALNRLFHEKETLQQKKPAVLTVKGTEKLLFLNPKNEQSEVEKFIGYLQWGRETLMKFPYPIVLWLTYQMLDILQEKAPDFWSWRKGVFRFDQETPILPKMSEPMVLPSPIETNQFESSLSLEDLADLIARTEKRNPQEPKLGSLYRSLGNLYELKVKQGNNRKDL